MKRSDNPADHVPLPPAALHIVLALQRGKRHGYALMQDVEQLSGGAVTMGPGTLYGSVKKLVSAGLIEEAPVTERDGDGDERRRYYRLTGLGGAVAGLEVERLTTLLLRTDRAAVRRLLRKAEA